MKIGDTLKKAAGLFVEVEEGGSATAGLDLGPMPEDPLAEGQAAPAKSSAKTVDQIVRESPGPNLEDVKVPEEAATPTTPVLTADGHVNFAAIYGLAKLPVAAFTAEQVLELLNSLPKDLPLESRRTTLKVTLETMAKTLGVNAQSIVTDASRKLAALDSYSKGVASQASQFADRAEVEIAVLEQQIEQKKKAIESAKKQTEVVAEACTAEAARLDQVLEFFSLDVPPSAMAENKGS